MSTPKISVLMAVYNGAAYLAAAVESILAQTFGDFEFIIVDDGSSDDSPEILRRFAQADGRIRVISRPNTGLVGALNDGLAMACGPYVARMDADDLSHPERFARQLAWLDAHPEYAALGCATLFTDPEGRPLKVYAPHPDHEAIENDLAAGNGGALIHAGCLFRRDALLRCGGYREECRHLEDLDLFIRLLGEGRLANLADVLYFYRQHPLSVNHVQGNRDLQAAPIVAPLRQKKGLPPWNPQPQTGPRAGSPADFRRQWALDAAEGQNYDSAWANALQAVRLAPFKKINWSCLRYIHGLRRAKKSE